jgi:hypothetical protein
MQERMSPTLTLRVVMAVHTVRLLRFPARAVSDRFGRLLVLVMPQHEGFRAKWDSAVLYQIRSKTRAIEMRTS